MSDIAVAEQQILDPIEKTWANVLPTDQSDEILNFIQRSEQYEAGYFHLKDEIRNSNKGITRLARTNRVLRYTIDELQKQNETMKEQIRKLKTDAK
jgi:predicted RNase H-like nuclease (RuvC/YqgF family)